LGRYGCRTDSKGTRDIQWKRANSLSIVVGTQNNLSKLFRHNFGNVSYLAVVALTQKGLRIIPRIAEPKTDIHFVLLMIGIAVQEAKIEPTLLATIPKLSVFIPPSDKALVPPPNRRYPSTRGTDPASTPK
jgi:hypothetical protein